MKIFWLGYVTGIAVTCLLILLPWVIGRGLRALFRLFPDE